MGQDIARTGPASRQHGYETNFVQTVSHVRAVLLACTGSESVGPFQLVAAASRTPLGDVVSTQRMHAVTSFVMGHFTGKLGMGWLQPKHVTLPRDKGTFAR